MSSNRPPQLQLSLHAENGTSFKRSFEQYGFDLDTPLSGNSEAGGSGSSGVGSGSGNDRNKRARSESSLSNSDEIADSSGSSEMGATGSSGVTSISEDDSLSGLSATRPISLTSDVLRLSPPRLAEPPRLPTPDFEDIQMAVLDDSEPLASPSIPSASVSDQDESYRISLERFNAFDSEISALRQPTSRSSASPPILPRLSSLTGGQDDAANRRPLSPPFRNLEFVEEDSNIPGLQVFTLGEIHPSEHDTDRREATMHFQPAIDRLNENHAFGWPSQNGSREPPQPRFSTQGPHTHRVENLGPAREQLALPPFSPPPLLSQQDLEWWSSELSNGDASTRPPSRPRPAAPPRDAIDYMAPRNWFDAPSSSRDRRTGTPPTYGTASRARRQDISRSRDPRLRRMEVVDDASDEDRPVPFPTIAQLSQDRYEQVRPAPEHHRNLVAAHIPSGPSSGPGEEGHSHQSDFEADLPLDFSRVDWSPFEHTDPPPRPRISLAPRSHEAHEQARRRPPGSRLQLPRIETSGSGLNLRPHPLDRLNPHGPPLQRSPDSTGSPRLSNPAALRRSSVDRMAAMSVFLRRSAPFNRGPSSNTNTSHFPASISSEDDVESSEMDWSRPLYHTGDPSRRPASTAQEPFHSRLYSSRVAASNSLVSENAAELRRSLARSQMLQTLPQDDETLDDFPTLVGSNNPWRAVREPETDPWTQTADRAAMLRDGSGRPPLRPRPGSLAGDSPWRDRSSNPLLRPYTSSSTTRTVGRPDNGDHRFNPLVGPPSNSPFGRGVPSAASVSNLGRDHIQPDMFAPSQVAAMSAISPASSPVLDSPPSNRQIPHRTRAFSSSVDPYRGISTARPVSAQSPVAWEDVMYPTAHSPLRADSPISRQTDHDLRTRARQRSSLVDVGIFRSPSPPSPVEPASRSPEPPGATPVSTYGSLDLSAYHEGPFRASLQRYVDLDRIRSRLNRLESIADNGSSQATPSRPPLPPSLPPFRFDSDDDLLSAGNASRRATNSARQPISSSPTNDQDLNFPHMVREARLGRGPLPTPAALQSTQNYGRIDENRSVREPDIRTERNRLASWRARMDSSSAINHPASPYSLEDENRLQRQRFHMNEARMQPYRNQMTSSGLVNPPPNTRAISPLSQPVESDVYAHSNRIAEERANNRISSIRARVRAQMDARAQARIDAQRTENAGANGFGEAMDILSADGLSNSTQRQFFDRYQRARDTDTSGSSAVDTDLGESGSRFWPARTRYARRGRVYRPPQPDDSAISAQRASSQSPSRNRNSSERLAASAAALTDRTARLRAPRERVHRDREFMLGDLPRFDLLHYTQRPVRNMGDYMRDEDFDSSYESLLSLASTLGEARPRATPNHVIAALPTGFYKDWQTPDSDQRCPICLDDYKPLDPVLKLSDCSHWLHKDCLEQWLHSASTCPVCRKRVKGARCPRYPGQDSTISGSGSNSHAGDGDDYNEVLPEGFGSGTPPWRYWE